MWGRRLFGPPVIVTIYLLLAIASSALWLYSFNLQIFDAVKEKGSISSQQRKALLGLLVAYVTHLPFLVMLPFISRPWLWTTDQRPISLVVLCRLLGWEDDGGDEWWKCLLGGGRAGASFLLAWAPFAFATRGSHASLAGILGLAFEGFFVAEMVKHTEAEDGFFLCQMAAAAAAGIGGSTWWKVFSVCILLIFLHSVLPYYEDVFTLLPEPEESAVPGRGAAPPPSAHQVAPDDELMQPGGSIIIVNNNV